MLKRLFKAAAIATSASFLAVAAQAADVIKIGQVAPKSGPLAGGAAVTQWPNVELWSKQVNAAGGLNVGGKKMMVEIIEYDDKTNPGEHIKAAQRLAEVDKVDFIIAPYGTGFNLAAAPIYAKYNYPHIGVSAISDKMPELTARYDNLFFTLGNTTSFTDSVIDILKDMRDAGTIGNRVAMVNVADAFGIELAEAARPKIKEAGFDIVYDKSYPPDTFGLTEQAIIQDLNVKMYYTAVATCFPAFKGKFGSKIEGVFGAGGVNQESSKIQEYFKAHKEITGKEADGWASANTYVSMQILGQAIEGAGTLDRKTVTQYIKDNTFDTIMGPISFENQISNKYWTVGQWQDGKFRGVKSSQMDGAAPIVAKDGWN